MPTFRTLDAPEVPLNFSLDQHQMRTGIGDELVDLNIAMVPAIEPSRLIRWFGLRDQESVDDALQLARLQQTHLGQLASFGLRVPVYQTFLGKSVGPSDQSQLSVFNLVEYIPHAPLQGQHAKRQVGQTLQKYIDWVRKSKASEFMSDLYSSRQYGVDGSDHIALLDIEPRVHKAARQILLHSERHIRYHFG